MLMMGELLEMLCFDFPPRTKGHGCRGPEDGKGRLVRRTFQSREGQAGKVQFIREKSRVQQ